MQNNFFNNILLIRQFGDRIVLQGLKWRVLIGLETKNGKNKM